MLSRADVFQKCVMTSSLHAVYPRKDMHLSTGAFQLRRCFFSSDRLRESITVFAHAQEIGLPSLKIRLLEVVFLTLVSGRV
ncbi:hypothetical protein BFW90_21725 [Pseudomonas fluorescens]|nr:hypothetical protein BFW90_21725 [Pseudomonas fluorescens]